MKLTDYTIRPALLEDTGVLQNLIAISARLLSVDDYTTQEIDAAIKYIFGVDSEIVADGTYYVVEDGNKPIACGGWSRRRTLFGGDQYERRETGLLDPANESAKIRAFFVHPVYARKGIGSTLLKHCEAQARIYGFSSVEMMATLPGVKLYRAFGYEGDNIEICTTPDGTPVRFIPMKKRFNL